MGAACRDVVRLIRQKRSQQPARLLLQDLHCTSCRTRLQNKLGLTSVTHYYHLTTDGPETNLQLFSLRQAAKYWVSLVDEVSAGTFVEDFHEHAACSSFARLATASRSCSARMFRFRRAASHHQRRSFVPYRARMASIRPSRQTSSASSIATISVVTSA